MITDMHGNDLVIKLELPTGDGDTWPIYLPGKLIYRLATVLRDEYIEPDQAEHLATLGAFIGMWGHQEQMTGTDAKRIQASVRALMRGDVLPRFKQPEDTALWLSYRMQQQYDLNYNQVAEYASFLLDRPVNPVTWRHRLRHWASKYGYPPIKMKRGRPFKKSLPVAAELTTYP